MLLNHDLRVQDPNGTEPFDPDVTPQKVFLRGC